MLRRTVMEQITVYHNPSCSKSRGALEILREHNVACDVVEYLKEPLDRSTLSRVLDMLTTPPGDLVRRDKRFKELGLSEADCATREHGD